jgi:hypothetical protein
VIGVYVSSGICESGVVVEEGANCAIGGAVLFVVGSSYTTSFMEPRA